MNKYHRTTQLFRSSREGVFGAVIFVATTVLFVGGMIAELAQSGLIAA